MFLLVLVGFEFGSRIGKVDGMFRDRMVKIGCVLLMAGAVHAAAPPWGDALLETQFDAGGDWKEGWQGDVEAWELFPAQSRTHLRNTGGKGKELRRELRDAAGRAVGVDLSFGWMWGRGDAGAALILRDASGEEGLRVDIRQAAGEAKYRVTRFAADGEEVVGTASGEQVDTGLKGQGDLPAGRLKLEWSPEGVLTLRRDGESAHRFEADPFAPAALVVRDTSSNREALVLTAVRAYAGADPFFDEETLGFSFGATFVEGERGDWTARLTWPIDRPRRVSVSGRVERDDGGEARDFEAEADLLSGQTWRPDLGFSDLSPGRYTLHGTLRVDAIERTLEHRFAVLSADLAGRPDEEVPSWIGVVDQIPRYPDSLILPMCSFMHRIGVRHVRWSITWAIIEPEKGVYDWSSTDRVLSFYDLFGFELMGFIGYWGPAGADILGAHGERMALSPEGRAFWVEHYAEEAFKRYGHRVKHWQIWNEPNAFWNEDPKKATGFAVGIGSPSNYFDLFRRSHEAGRRIDPDLKILASLASASQMENLELLAGMGLTNIFDGLVIHTYGNPAKHLTDVQRWMKKHGHEGKDLIVGETGRGGATGSFEAEVSQAVHVPEVFFSAASVEGVVGIDWFVLCDGFAPYGFGLTDWRFEPTLSTVAYHTTARLMSGAVGATSRTEGPVRIHVIERDGRPPLTGMWVVGETGAVRVGLRNRSDQPPVAWNLMGRRRDLRLGEGTTWIDLDGDPLLIEGDVEVALPLHMSLIPASGGDLRVTWSSETAMDARGKLTVEAPGLRPERRTMDVRLAGKDTDVVVPLEGAEPGERYSVRAVWTSEDGDLSAMAERQVGFTPAPRVTDEQAQSLRRPEGHPHWIMQDYTRSKGQPLQGPGDLSAEMALGWTDDYLVLWIEQTDDIWVPVTEHPWGEDGPQFSLDPANERSQNAFFVEYNFGLRADGSPLAMVWGQPHYNPQLIGKREGDRTYYRLLIPFGDFNVEPEAGKPMSATLIINENDGDGREGWLSWGGGVAESKNPALYREFVLTPAVE
jgi:hypothetical protein